MPARRSSLSLTVLLVCGTLIVAASWWRLWESQDQSEAHAASQQLARLQPSAVTCVRLSSDQMTPKEVTANRFVRARALTDTAAIRNLVGVLQQSVPYYPYQGKPSGPWRLALVFEQRDGTQLRVQVYANPITYLVAVTAADGSGPHGVEDYLINHAVGPVLVSLMQAPPTSP